MAAIRTSTDHVRSRWALVAAATITLLACAPSASANGDYGPDTCLNGYVWREASTTDHVCVTPDVRTQTASDNNLAASRRSPTGGAFGPDTCLTGYVWRGAFASDHVCVIPTTRDQAASDNLHAAERRDAIDLSVSTFGPRQNFVITSTRINMGPALIVLVIGGRKLSASTTVLRNPTAPGGLLVYRSKYRRCTRAQKSNGYFLVQDGSSTRWSSRVSVCVV